MVVSLINPLTARERVERDGFSLKQNPGPGLCHVRGCRSRHADDRKKVGEVRFCHACWQERWRRMNPKEAAYATLRAHALKRRIGFTLTFARFVEVTDVEGFWYYDAATHGDRLSIDRIRAWEGYANDNVQVLTVSENTVKGNKERWLPEHVRAVLARKRQTEAWAMSGPAEDGWLEDDRDPF